MLQGPKRTIRRARRLRREMSLPEVLLWQALRERPNGLKFRNQHPAGDYVADFFCHKARLVVEVDGEAHDRGDRPERDQDRDTWFLARRFRVLRIPAREVLDDLENVIRGIVAAAIPPLQGEGNHAQHGGGVSASEQKPVAGARLRRVTPLRQASPATSPRRGGLED
jgi:very-short-patch-repair endonuclease